MPHVIYLHSALTQGRVPPRDDAERKRLLRFQRIDVSLAMGIAGLVNMSMLVIAAALFHDRGLLGLDSIEEAHAQFTALAGGGAALAFAVALLASGLASSSVGTYAGQVVMQGFIARTIPIVLRRLITMTPALIVLAIGLNPSRSLVISQVVLSFGIPFALVPLVLLTRRKDIMGPLVNRTADDRRGLDRGRAHHRAQPLPDRRHALRLAPAAADPRELGDDRAHRARDLPGLAVVVAGAMAVVAHHVGEAVRAVRRPRVRAIPAGVGEQPAQVAQRGGAQRGASDRRRSRRR